jgi:hypothetical protein
MQLEQNIIKITTTIKQEYPELSKFIIEMPRTMESEEVTIKSLEEYYNFRRSSNKICKTHSETEIKEIPKHLNMQTYKSRLLKIFINN